jgi:excisionase family DNA binding protein
VTLPTQTPILSLGDRILAFTRAMTAQEVATLFDIHLNTVYVQARAGNMPSFRIGTSIRFDPKKLAEWYRKQSIG